MLKSFPHLPSGSPFDLAPMSFSRARHPFGAFLLPATDVPGSPSFLLQF